MNYLQSGHASTVLHIIHWGSRSFYSRTILVTIAGKYVFIIRKLPVIEISPAHRGRGVTLVGFIRRTAYECATWCRYPLHAIVTQTHQHRRTPHCMILLCTSRKWFADKLVNTIAVRILYLTNTPFRKRSRLEYNTHIILSMCMS